MPDPTTTSGPSPSSERDAPPRRWRWWVRGGVLPPVLMIAVYLAALATAPLQPAVATLPPMGRELFLAGLRLSVPALGIAYVWLLMRYVDRRPLREAGLTLDRRSLPALLLGLGAAALVILPASLVLHGLGLLHDASPRPGPLALALLAAVIPGVVMQGFTEELIWRGYLTQTLPRSWNPWAVALWSSTPFGLLHLLSAGGQTNLAERFLYAAHALGFAFLACALQRLTGQLWAAVGVHGGLHLCATGTGWAGLGSGPARWAAELALYLLLAVAAMLWVDRRHLGRVVAPRTGA